MPGGFGKIDEYNKSLTPEQRKINASRAGRAGGKKTKAMRDIAKVIAMAKAPEETKETLKMLGIEDEDMTNSALLVSSLFKAAFDGNMGAFDRFMTLAGETATQEEGQGKLASLIDALVVLKDEGGKDE